MQPNLKTLFLDEAEDLLAQVETAALELRDGAAGRETIDTLFRALHTLKGSGSMAGFVEMAGFAHEVETLLDRAREGMAPVSAELAGVMLASGDQIRQLLDAAQGGPAVDNAGLRALLERVRELSGAPVVAAGVAAVGAPAPAEQDGKAGRRAWRIRFRPNPELFRQGCRPDLVLGELRQLGECVVTCHVDQVPLLEKLDPATCHFWWTIELRSTAGLAEIRDAFLFVEDGAELVIEAWEEAPAPAAAAATPAPERKPEDAAPAAAREATVRVPAGRLDRLVNLVGELVMNQSRLATAAAHFRSPELAAPVEEIERLVAELRDDVLQIRMMPIGSIFGRFRRLVHDLSGQLGKEIELVTAGEETELDKSILDQLGEPLVHLLRNSMDHGIESAEARRAKGKPARGTLRLTAVHRGSDVVVSLEDDGAGLDRDRIRAKAVAKGLIAADANLSDKDVLNLILLPGFSTAAQITDISGRGVGMDVVKRQIDALRGTLALSSEPGQGTTVSITLPLTLAIIDGLLVEVGESQYIIPLASVTENVELSREDRRRHNGRNLVDVRGDLVPYIDLREGFAIPGEPPPLAKIVLVRHEDQRVGLVVDRVLGTHQTVIQALGRFFRRIEVVSGCTVMGDGRVALVLDIAGVVRVAERERRVAEKERAEKEREEGRS